MGLSSSPTSPGSPAGVVVLNDCCWLQERDGYRVVSLCGLPVLHFASGDRAGEAHAMVSLVDLRWAHQSEVARAFGCDVRTVRRHQRRFEEGGLAALGRPRGFPRGQDRVPQSRKDAVNRWKAEGVSNREIARRLGIDEKAVRKLARRLGWQESLAEQRVLPFGGADPKLSGLEHQEAGGLSIDGGLTPDPEVDAGPAGADPKLSGSADPGSATARETGAQPGEANGSPADPERSAPGIDEEPVSFSLDRDPADRSGDRLLARLGLLEDAAPPRGATPWASSTSTATCAPTTAAARSRRPTSPGCGSRCWPPPTTGSTTLKASRSSSSPPRPTPGWSRSSPRSSPRCASSTTGSPTSASASNTAGSPGAGAWRCARSPASATPATRRPSSPPGGTLRPSRSPTTCSSAGGRRTSSSTSARSMRSTTWSITAPSRPTPSAACPIPNASTSPTCSRWSPTRPRAISCGSSPHYRRTEQEGRTLIESAFAGGGDLEVTASELRIALDPLSSPHKTLALAAVCDELNATATRFPGTQLRMRFTLKPEPPRSLAFPGARSPSDEAQPDILEQG